MIIYSKHGIEIECSPVDCRTLLLKSNKVLTFAKKDMNIDLVTVDNYILTIGDTIKIPISNRVYEYKVNSIEKKSDKEFFILTMDRNKTSIFLMPLLRIKNETRISFEYDHYLMNLYIDNKDLIALYRFFPHPQYNNVETLIFNHEYYNGLIELPDGYSAFRFKIPFGNFHDDIELLQHGKYSKLSEELKKRAIFFHGIDRNSKNDILGVLSKSDWLKKRWEEELAMRLDDELELASKPDLKNELWENLNIIKQRELQ